MPARTLPQPSFASPRDVAHVSFRALGTVATLLIESAVDLDRGRALLEEELAAIDLACSRFRADSELSRLNHADGRPLRISPLLIQALGVALDAAEATCGDVDPTCGRALIDLGYDRDFAEVARSGARGVVTARAVPGWQRVQLDRESRTARVPAGVVLDLGATAKALAADRAAARIHAATGCGVLVNLGGDLAVAGPVPDGGWRIRVTDDEDAIGAGPEQSVAIHEGGLATSGTAVRSWRRGSETVHHIIVPATGLSAPPHWRTVTVAGATCVAANTASTAAIVRGQDAVPWLESLAMPARLVRPDGGITYTGPWPRPNRTSGYGL
jgi:FAD:protein FMN transferase